MAAAIAYEQPSMESSWRAFMAHLGTLFVVLLLSVSLSLVGSGVAWLVQFVAEALLGASTSDGSAAILLATLISRLAQLPFIILSSVVGILLTAIPAMHYETGQIITIEMAFATLMRRPWRYILAGLLFGLASTIGFFMCILPGIVILLTTPVYVNRIFNGEASIINTFTGSFQAIFGSDRGMTFIGIQLLTVLVVIVVSICTCGLGGLIAGPMATFYIQNSAYRQGILR